MLITEEENKKQYSPQPVFRILSECDFILVDVNTERRRVFHFGEVDSRPEDDKGL